MLVPKVLDWIYMLHLQREGLTLQQMKELQQTAMDKHRAKYETVEDAILPGKADGSIISTPSNELVLINDDGGLPAEKRRRLTGKGKSKTVFGC